MGSLDFFSPSAPVYPTGSSNDPSTPCGGPYVPPEADGFFNKLFGPVDLPYPLPPCERGKGAIVVVPADPQAAPRGAPPGQWGLPLTPMAPAAAPMAPSGIIPTLTPVPIAPAAQPTAPVSQPIAPAAQPAAPATPSAPTPVTVVVNLPAPAESPSAPPSASPAPVATPILAPTAPAAPPCDKIITAYSSNPCLRARQKRAHEEYLEDVLDENCSLRMLARDTEPVLFVVPPGGYTAVEFYLGPVELDPCNGEPEDLEDVITPGEPEIEGASGCVLTANDEISVMVPWRHASWVELPPDRLRIPIIARFHVAERKERG